jgi:MGT family glycosyltransferase
MVARDFPRRASALRQKYGLPPLRSTVMAHLATVPLYIVPSAPEFDYERRDLPPSVKYVGPLLWNRPMSIPEPAWLPSLRSDVPWVHATEGTVHVTDPFVLRAAAQGLGGLDMEVLLTSGAHRDPDQLDIGPRASNIHVARWISHAELLPKVSVFVTTGGAGSVLASLMAGVPLICIPTEWDKPEIAQRVVESGTGLRIAPERCSPANLRKAVERIAGDSTFRKNVERIRHAFVLLGGPDRAAELLEAQAAGGFPR